MTSDTVSKHKDILLRITLLLLYFTIALVRKYRYRNEFFE